MGNANRTYMLINLAALGFLVVFVLIQQAAIDNKDFLYLMFFSFIFLAIGAYLNIRAFVKSSKSGKRLCLIVAIVFIIAILFVANSLAHTPRGGFYKDTYVTPSSFTLTTESYSYGIYRGDHLQIIYLANYPTALIQVSSLHDSFFRVISQTSARLNATVYFFPQNYSL